jgi:uncharacterized protein
MENFMKGKLIIFTKNLVEGRVKARIANKIGTKKALKVHQLLLIKTMEMARSLPENIQPVLYFSDFLDNDPFFTSYTWEINLQKGKNIGDRMSNAIETEILSGNSPVCLIGSDIYDLNKDIIMDAFNRLSDNELVLGPAKDGGYYLIGMCKSNPEIFKGLDWGMSSVLEETKKRIISSGLKYSILSELNDVDLYEDIPKEILKSLESL